MQLINKLLLSIFFLVTSSYAITPFSLEGVKEVNIHILSRDKTISKETIKTIKDETIELLQDAGIKTETDSFSNFLIRIKVEKIENKFLVMVSVMLNELVSPLRDKDLSNIAITYQKSDVFVPDELNEEVYESVIEYLIPSFLEQYEEEN